MVALSFFISVFTTVVWLIFSVTHIVDNLSGMPFSSLSIQDSSMQMLVVVIPIFIIWMIFGYVLQFVQAKSIGSSMMSLFKQMKKNQDYTDLIARIMLEAEREVKDGFILNRFDLFISDMNELIAEVIYRANIASNEQIERLWKKIQNGGKWAFGKVIVEVNGNQPNFQLRLFEKSRSDNVLAGSILEFCARYSALIALLEKHDKNRVFLDVIETGVFGKAFTIMSPIANEIRHSRESLLSQSQMVSDEPEAILPRSEAASKPKAKKIYNPEAMSENRPSIVNKLNIFKKKEEPVPAQMIEKNVEDQRFSAALERSFGIEEPKTEEKEPSFFAEETLKRDEPLFVDDEPMEERRPAVNAQPKYQPQNDIKQEPRIEVPETNTQRALDSLKKEWQGLDEKTSYPFSGWSDEDNYK